MGLSEKYFLEVFIRQWCMALPLIRVSGHVRLLRLEEKPDVDQ